jgi:hypothetical protein
MNKLTPKQKAIELVDKFYQRFPLTMDVITTEGDLSWEYDSWKEAKQCALIAIDELISQQNSYNNGSFYPSNYWQQVKQEIEHL